MLLGLTIRDVVLIERLSLAFRPGLCVLTGETGAGKSILMDALGLALGRRAEAGLVRPGAEQAAVAAEFAVGGNHPASAILDKAGIATDLSGIIVLRRIVTADGRSRAFVNDEPASVGLLRELGDNLVEIQGQGEQRGLLDPATHRELLDAFAEIGGETGAQQALARALRRLERTRDRAQGLLDNAMAAAERAAAETADALEALSSAAQALELDPRALEQVEERLFAMRAVARKHGLTVADLPRLLEGLAARLAAIETGAEDVIALERAASVARERYVEVAAAVSRARERAARRLDAAISGELKPLRLDKARFRTVLAPLAEPDWGEHGCERVHFEVLTNPGAGFGPLARIASGGELSRFMLALKLVLAGTSSVPTLIFDEVDSGIGGAVAAAVGERLQRLGSRLQVLVVTHSPQVAARGAHHWRVAKKQGQRETITSVEELDADTRQEEIARMLSGSTITAEARAAAASLIAGARP